MAKHSSPLIDRIIEESLNFDFPAELQFNEYRDAARQADIVQVHFRYHPFSGINEKFAFELAFTDKSQLDIDHQYVKEMRTREIRQSLSGLEAAWKNQFNFVKYRGVPYAKRIDGSTFELKCEICDADMEIDTGAPKTEVEHRQDLFLIYCLKNIDCDCDDGWSIPPIGKDLTVMEGQRLPRFTVS